MIHAKLTRSYLCRASCRINLYFNDQFILPAFSTPNSKLRLSLFSSVQLVRGLRLFKGYIRYSKHICPCAGTRPNFAEMTACCWRCCTSASTASMFTLYVHALCSRQTNVRPEQICRLPHHSRRRDSFVALWCACPAGQKSLMKSDILFKVVVVNSIKGPIERPKKRHGHSGKKKHRTILTKFSKSADCCQPKDEAHCSDAHQQRQETELRAVLREPFAAFAANKVSSR